MILIELLVLLIAVAGALRILAQKWGVPHPVLLVLGGLVVAMIPELPQPNVDPDLLFTIFVPPLLYWSALTISLREMRAFFGPIVRLGTGLVIVTMCAVAAIVHVLMPMVGWPEAFVLGAIVSPPDPVAATAVLRPLGAPRDVTTILEGEGLINDATALVAYRLAVAAVVAGSFSLWSAAGSFVVTGVGGALIGLAVGWLIALLRTVKNNPLEAWTQAHFEQPVVMGGLSIGRVAVVSDPGAIRRVLLENCANYQKDWMQRRILSAGLANGLLSAEGR